MADRYIDVFEITEYGDFFVSEVKRLEGTSDLVNIESLRERVRRAKERVEAERTKAGVSRKSASGSATLASTAEELRGHLNRFYNFLNSLDPKEVKVDIEKFFPKNVLAGLQQLKPADLKARAEKISEGFALEPYRDLEALSSWKKKIEGAVKGLSDALSGRAEERNDGILLTASLSAAREEFLFIYNGVAKNLLKGLLHSLGRGEDYPLYFKDLQVNEDRRSEKTGEGDKANPPTEPKAS